MPQKEIGYIAIAIGVAWFVVTLFIIRLTEFWLNFILSVLLTGAGAGALVYHDYQIGLVKKRISVLEDNVRRTKSLVMEFNLGTEYETALDGIRIELSDLYIKPKIGEAVDKLLGNCEETVKELAKCVEEKDKERVKRTISLLRDRVADIRSEFRR